MVSILGVITTTISTTTTTQTTASLSSTISLASIVDVYGPEDCNITNTTDDKDLLVDERLTD